MHTRARHHTLTPRWTTPVAGLALEPVTNWHPPLTQPEVSDRVKLEVQILASEQTAPVPVLTRADVRLRRTVLLVSRQAEVRRQLRACLQEHPKLRLVEVNSVNAAVSLASEVAIHLIIADPGTVGVTEALPAIRTILLADAQQGATPFTPAPGRHVMQRPFSDETLAATVLLLLKEADAG